MNIVKFNDKWLTLPDPNTDVSTWKDQSYIGDMIDWVDEYEYFKWKHIKELPKDDRKPLASCGMKPQNLVEYFEENFRNSYAYVVNWQYLLPITTTTGTPWGNEENTYIYFSLNPDKLHKQTLDEFFPKILLTCFDESWYDQTTTIKLIRNEQIKYDYLNQFTPDDDITIEELKRFRQWLAEILLANEPLIQEWPSEDMLRIMLTYYKQNMVDTTITSLNFLTPYMEQRVLVAGTSQQTLLGLTSQNTILGLSGISHSAGCGCTTNNGLLNYNGSANVACDPINIYRTALYNYMVETFSNLNYWTQQVEICIEMKKYIDGILKAGLPLSSNKIDTFADCTCSSVDTDMELRYRKMLENLSLSLTYIIEDQISGNKNFILTSFSDWATYLYENMYWA